MKIRHCIIADLYIFGRSRSYTCQSITSLKKVPIEILPGKRYIMWVLTVSLFTAEIQIEPLAPHETRPATYLTYYWLEQIQSSTASWLVK